MQREAEVERALVQRVRRLGLLIRKVEWIGRRGAPDRLILLPDGRVRWVELKTLRGKITEGQAHEHRVLREFGQQVDVVTTVEDAAAWTP